MAGKSAGVVLEAGQEATTGSAAIRGLDGADFRVSDYVWSGEVLKSPFAFDTETTVREDYGIPSFVLATAYDGERSVVVPAERLVAFMHAQARSLSTVWLGFNWAFDWWVLKAALPQEWNSILRNLVDGGQLRDLMILDQLIRLARGIDDSNGIYPRNLSEVAKEYAGYGINKKDPYRLRFGELAGLSADDWSGVDSGFFVYALKDTIATWEAAVKMLPLAKELDGRDVQTWGSLGEQVQIRSAIALVQMERLGVKIDRDYVAKLYEEKKADVVHHFGTMDLLVPGAIKRKKNGEPRNKNGLPLLSHNTLQEEFGELEDPSPRSPKTGRVSLQTGVWTERLPEHPIVNVWQRLNDDKKTLQFVQQLVDAGEEVHSRYNNLVRTGRTSASGPNIQQMPKEDWFRKAFVPRPGHKFVVADYSAIELCTLAAVCYANIGWSVLGETIKAGQDPHAKTASMILGLDYDTFRDKKHSEPEQYRFYRQAAKAINFGVPGGLGPTKLATYARRNYGVDLSTEQAGQFRDKLINEVYPELAVYLRWNALEALSYNTGIPHEQLSDLWYGRSNQLPTDLEYLRSTVQRQSEVNDWHLWVMEKIVQGETHSRKGAKYADFLVEKTWKFIKDLIVLGDVRRWDELKYYIHATEGSASLHKKLFSIPVQTLTGRVRGGALFTEAKNTPFQGLAADGAKLALWRLVAEGYRPVAFVHDEIVVEVPAHGDEHKGVFYFRDPGPDIAAGHAKRVVEIMQQEMAQLLGGVPVKVEYTIADYWAKP